jgi:hypothetical protein
MSKYPRTFHLPFSLGTTSDDRIATDVSSILNKKIVITEKLDGENRAITKGGIYARSHADYTRNPWAQKSWELWNKIGKDIPENMTLFGEDVYAIHSIEYHNLKNFFYLFGIKDDDVWLSWDDVKENAYLLDLETVPELFVGEFETELELKDKILELVAKPSHMGSTIMEGCVIRIYDQFDDIDFSTSVFKWVREKHVRTDAHWSRNWKRADIKYS